MAWASWRPGLIFLFIICVKSIPLYIKTNVGDRTDLPCNKTCNAGLVRWVHSMTSDSARRSIEEVIAELNNMAFSTPSKYDNKVKKGNTAYSIILMRTEYNHNGVYVCSCDKEHLQEVDLKVLYHVDKLCYVRENVTLSFFEETKGLDDNRFAFCWKKDGQSVVRIIGRNTEYSEGFENRLSVNKDAFETGNFSLTLTSVNSSDGGLYELIIDDGERLISGHPQAYKLTVQVSPAALSEETAEPFCNYLILIWCLATFVCTLLLGIGIRVLLAKSKFLSRFFSSKQEGHHRANVPGNQVTSDECVALTSSVQEQGVPEQLSTVKPTEGDEM